MAKKRLTYRQRKAARKYPTTSIDNSSVFPSGWEPDETCPLCGGTGNAEARGYDDPIDGVSVKHWHDTMDRIMAEHPEWSAEDGACVRCLAYYGMARAGRAGEET